MTFINRLSLDINFPKISFSGTARQVSSPFQLPKDSIITAPINRNFALSESQLFNEAKLNPRIVEIFKEYNLPLKVNYKELESLRKGHLQDTRVTAAKLYSSLPLEMKKEVNLQNLQEAAMYHDYGKVLIPEKILNKTSTLTESEHKIMELHPILSYELLKNKNVNEDTLNLIKYHHQTSKGTGYPQIEGDYEFDLSTQILNVSDRYSALREQRSYKPALTKNEALTIIKEDVDKGNISASVYNALASISY